jgi:D-glycero-D-manno-heptose 1,7-bisphosphate phosphatase
MSGRPAVFFDRDGTLMADVDYCRDPRDVQVYPGAAEALARLKKAGYAVFIITNQSGIGRGLMTEEQYRTVETEFLRQAGEASIDGTYFCADAPGVASSRRKPEPGMVLEAAREHGIDLSRSYFIGDKKVDIECGRRAGVRTIQVMTGYGASQPGGADLVAADVVEAVKLLLGP